MVKGISRRVIVVRSPDPCFFEQAIFLMKEDAFHNNTVSADQVVAEARQAAAGYLRRSAGVCGAVWRSWLPKALWFALGGGVIAAVWGAEFPIIRKKRCLNNRQRFFAVSLLHILYYLTGGLGSGGVKIDPENNSTNNNKRQQTDQHTQHDPPDALAPPVADGVLLVEPDELGGDLVLLSLIVGERRSQQVADGNIQHVSDLQQNIRIRHRTSGLPLGNRLPHHVEPDGQLLLGQPLLFP